MREKYQEEIESKIAEFAPEYAFSAADFRNIADTDPVNKALSRLCEEGIIRRVVQGIYDKPMYSQLLQEYSAPNIENIASAIARKFNWTIAPAGETALNYLHLSTQVPNSWCYISDGPYRDYEIGPYRVEFKHCANKEISGRSYITIIVIQALKYIGKDKIQEEDILRLKTVLTTQDKETLSKEAITASAWMYKLIKEIVR